MNNTEFIETETGRVAYETRGAGPTLVLLHAAGHDRHDFDAIVPALARSHRVVAIDWPGHGESDAPVPPEATSVVLLADVLETIVERLDLGRAVFFGNSVGGFAATRLAIRHPDRVRGLVLVDTGGFNDPGPVTRWFCRFKGSPRVTAALWNAFASFYIKKRSPHARAILERVRAAKSEQAVAINAAIWRSFALPEHDLRAAARQVKAPTLIVWGAADPVITLDRGRLAAERIPGAKLSVLKTGHVPFAEDPDGFLGVVLPFLETLP